MTRSSRAVLFRAALLTPLTFGVAAAQSAATSQMPALRPPPQPGAAVSGTVRSGTQAQPAPGPVGAAAQRPAPAPMTPTQMTPTQTLPVQTVPAPAAPGPAAPAQLNRAQATPGPAASGQAATSQAGSDQNAPDQGEPSQAAIPEPVSPETEQRIEAIKTQLSITPQQMPLWEAFAQAMRDNSVATDDLFSQRATAIASMNAAENMQSYAVITRAYAENTERLAAAFTSLYASLSAAQKKAADTWFQQEAVASAQPEPAK